MHVPKNEKIILKNTESMEASCHSVWSQAVDMKKKTVVTERFKI